MFGRKRSGDKAELDKDKSATKESTVTDVEESATGEGARADQPDEVAEHAETAVDEAESDENDADAAADEDEADEDETDDEKGGETDWRADGPFDFDEVDLHGDEVTRIDLDTLIVTPWDGLGLQLQVEEQSRQVLSVTGVWQESGLEVSLFAAPSSGGLGTELLEEAVNEVTAEGGTAELTEGEFGPEVRRVLPQKKGKGEQLYHVSRVWCAEGPRWVLRATLLGEAALEEAEDKAAPFKEFFRNLVVRRGSKPMVPGERIWMRLPEQES
jgi:hypothetical protein